MKYLLDRGAGPVYAIASASNATPTLIQRQAAWQTLEATRAVRIRLTDSVASVDHAGLVTSCNNANLLNNKQFAMIGMPTATAKAALITAVANVRSNRLVMVAPGVYDENGVLKSGAFAAASVAAMVCQNSDPSDDLIRHRFPDDGDRAGQLGQQRVPPDRGRGVVQNDFEDLLQAGISPLMISLDGAVAISHLRTTVITDSKYDSLMTRIIMDQLFVLIRNYAVKVNELRKGNTQKTRDQLASGIDALLNANNDIIQKIELGDGSEGYGVVVTSSADQRQQIISYQGEIVRGTQTILVAGSLVIAA